MREIKDLTNRKFGKLTVNKLVGKDKNGKYLWLCTCECGSTTTVRGNDLTTGKTKSCGCLKNESIIARSSTHGKCNKRIYRLWCAIKSRCYNPNQSKYRYYGLRGIVMCKEWKNSFQEFYNWSMNNGYSDNLTIDRINNNGNYEPLNCRWTTMKKQANNTTRNHCITYKGETYTLSEWANLLNMNYETLKYRINKAQWSIDKAFNTPINSTKMKR